MRASKPVAEGKGAVLALQQGPTVHLLQVASVWARDAWARHVGRIAQTPESKGLVVALRDSELSPSPIRNALKGQTRRTSLSKSAKAGAGTIRLGGAVCPPDDSDMGDSDSLPPGAIDAFNKLNLDED